MPDASRAADGANVSPPRRRLLRVIAAATVGGMSALIGGRLRERPAVAQGVPPPVQLPAKDRTYYMFVQNARGGTFTPVTGVPGRYMLVLEGVTPNTIYFSDRPVRDAGTVPNAQFLSRFNFKASNPPNAALVVLRASTSVPTSTPTSGEGMPSQTTIRGGAGNSGASTVPGGATASSTAGAQSTAIIELTQPVYNAGAATLTYAARMLLEVGSGIAQVSTRLPEPQGTTLPARFGDATLMIDDCPNANTITCSYALPTSPGSDSANAGTVLVEPYSCCWGGLFSGCTPCDPTAFQWNSPSWFNYQNACMALFECQSNQCAPSDMCTIF